jgi:hypothetical protein
MIRFTSSSESVSGVGAMTDDRRRSPRIELMSRLHGHSVSLDLPVRVVQISLGGMAIETRVAFPVGAVHIFRLTLGDGSTTELAGRVMHCRDVSPTGTEPAFVTGIQFVDDELGEGGPSVSDIIDRVT